VTVKETLGICTLVPQWGHRPLRPAVVSGVRIRLPQPGQWNSMGMRGPLEPHRTRAVSDGIPRNGAEKRSDGETGRKDEQDALAHSVALSLRPSAFLSMPE